MNLKSIALMCIAVFLVVVIAPGGLPPGVSATGSATDEGLATNITDLGKMGVRVPQTDASLSVIGIGQGQWEKLNGPYGGVVRSFAINPSAPQIIYAGTENGVYKSTDGSMSWTTINEGLLNLYVSSLVLDLQNPSIVYAGTNQGVFKWTPAAAPEIARPWPWYRTLVIALAVVVILGLAFWLLRRLVNRDRQNMVLTRIRTRSILSNWLLLTYDIPRTPAGDKARRHFLDNAKRIGAVQHTESVYLLPWTDKTLKLAAGVAEVGYAYLWPTKMEDKEYAREVTRTYDKKIKPRFDQIGERIDRIEGHVGRHPKTAQKMVVRTQNMLDDLEAAVVRRRSNELYKMVLKLRKRLEVL